MPSAHVHGVRLSRTLKGFLIMLINQSRLSCTANVAMTISDCNYKDLIMILALALDTR